MARVGILKAKVGTYTDRQTGEERNNYVTIGSVFETERGRSYKIESIPCGNLWDGWVYEWEPPETKVKQQARSAPPPAQQNLAPQEQFNDDIPF